MSYQFSVVSFQLSVFNTVLTFHSWISAVDLRLPDARIAVDASRAMY